MNVERSKNLPEPLPITFRPSMGLRVTAALVAILSAVSTAQYVNFSIHSPSPPFLTPVLIFMYPAIFGFGVMTRKIVVDVDGIKNVRPMGPVKYSWDKIVRLEETRKSFVIITSKGNISAGWIDPSRRDLLMRKVLELAKLTYVAEPPRWGIKAVYVTRLKPIKVEFAPKADASEKK